MKSLQSPEFYRKSSDERREQIGEVLEKLLHLDQKVAQICGSEEDFKQWSKTWLDRNPNDGYILNWEATRLPSSARRNMRPALLSLDADVGDLSVANLSLAEEE